MTFFKNVFTRYKKLSINTLFVLSARVVALASKFYFGVAAVKIFSPNDYVLYSLYVSGLGFYLMIAGLELHVFVNKGNEISDGRSISENNLIYRVWNNNAILFTVFTFFLLAILQIVSFSNSMLLSLCFSINFVNQERYRKYISRGSVVAAFFDLIYRNVPWILGILFLSRFYAVSFEILLIFIIINESIIVLINSDEVKNILSRNFILDRRVLLHMVSRSFPFLMSAVLYRSYFLIEKSWLSRKVVNDEVSNYFLQMNVLMIIPVLVENIIGSISYRGLIRDQGIHEYKRKLIFNIKIASLLYGLAVICYVVFMMNFGRLIGFSGAEVSILSFGGFISLYYFIASTGTILNTYYISFNKSDLLLKRNIISLFSVMLFFLLLFVYQEYIAIGLFLVLLLIVVLIPVVVTMKHISREVR